MIDWKELHTLHCQRDESVALITLNRPDALNALNATMFEELEQLFSELSNDTTIRVILITGAGERAFAAGADIRELTTVDSKAGKVLSQRGQRVFNAIEDCGKPVIACINGVALGGGCELALVCTLRIASEKAALGLPEVKLGLIPGYGGTQRMPRLIGQSAALRLMLTAKNVSAEEALRLGLVDEVVPAATLMARGLELAQTIANMAPLAISAILKAVAQGKERPLEQGQLAESEIFARLCDTEDKKEGLAAFLEKRPAAWRGQ